MMTSLTYRGMWLPFCAVAAIGLSQAPASCQVQAVPLARQMVAPYADGRLEITKHGLRYDLVAYHVDVRRVLSGLFQHEHRSFALDNVVTGTLTTQLLGLTFRDMVSAICEQCLMRYTIKPAGNVYFFTRDEAAVLRVFKKLNDEANARRSLQAADSAANAQIRQPSEEAAPLMQRFSAQGGVGNGSQNSRVAPAAAPRVSAPQADIVAGANALNAPGSPSAPGSRAGGATGNMRQSDTLLQDSGVTAPVIGSLPQIAGKMNGATDQQSDDYARFLKLNGLVEWNSPTDKPDPVIDVLESFSKQTNVPIYVSPYVTRGYKFRMSGRISARPLQEALSILAPTARLEWRWIGDSIFVTPAADFQIYYGNSDNPRAVYPLNNQIRQQNGAFNNNGSNTNAGAAAPQKSMPAAPDPPNKQP